MCIWRCRKGTGCCFVYLEVEEVSSGYVEVQEAHPYLVQFVGANTLPSRHMYPHQIHLHLANYHCTDTQEFSIIMLL